MAAPTTEATIGPIRIPDRGALRAVSKGRTPRFGERRRSEHQQLHFELALNGDRIANDVHGPGVKPLQLTDVHRTIHNRTSSGWIQPERLAVGASEGRL